MPLVTRKWKFEEKKIIILDQVNGVLKSDIKIHFYIHPDFEPIIINSHEVLIKNLKKEFNFLLCLSDNVDVKVNQSYWYPEFGKKEKNYSVLLKSVQNLPIQIKSVLKIVDNI